MNFWQIFLRVLPWRPAAALAAAWYQLTRRRVRARNRLRVAGAPLPFAYELWMRNVEREEAVAEEARLASEFGELAPRFTLIVDNRVGDRTALSRTLQSIQEQSAPLVHGIGVYGNAGDEFVDLEGALKSATGDFVIVLAAGSKLARNALFLFCKAAMATKDAAVLFGDEDRIDSTDFRRDPWFKPAWNQELFLAIDYVSRACALRTDAVRPAAQALSNNELTMPALILQIADSGGQIVHVPQILVHRDVPAQPSSPEHSKAVATAVGSRGGETTTGTYGTVRVAWPLTNPSPLVSIIIPTRDKVELLETCIETLLGRTTYKAIEIIVVDNGSEQPATLQFLERIATDPRVRILRAPGPYNYSALNNEAAAQARGEFLCLLNNDTEVIDGDWLSEMMRYAVRPEVGAVGAKLLYEDRSIQHAGVVVGIGDAAGHAHRFLPESASGYFWLPHATHYVSAVTGACLLVDRNKFEAVGALDAQAFAVAYNDVDFCLRLERAGWRNVYVPHAVLIHHESKSRGKDHAPDQIDRYRGELRRFQERWGIADYRDALLNPNLDRANETFVLRF